MDLTYTQCGDYLIPDLVSKEYHIGKYDRMCRACLKEHRSVLYTDLIVTEKLFPHLEEIAIACREWLKIMEKAMMQQEGVTEAQKAVNQMKRVCQMNSIHNRAEKIILHELYRWSIPRKMPPKNPQSCRYGAESETIGRTRAEIFHRAGRCLNCVCRTSGTGTGLRPGAALRSKAGHSPRQGAGSGEPDADSLRR